MKHFIRSITEWINSIFIFPIVECHRLDPRNIIGESPNVEVPRYMNGTRHYLLLIYLYHCHSTTMQWNTYKGPTPLLEGPGMQYNTARQLMLTMTLVYTCIPRVLPFHIHRDSKANAAVSRQTVESYPHFQTSYSYTQPTVASNQNIVLLVASS